MNTFDERFFALKEQILDLKERVKRLEEIVEETVQDCEDDFVPTKYKMENKREIAENLEYVKIALGRIGRKTNGS